ncbi:polymorphic toxin-type HINT domain-containing protein [Streptomyces sp. NPDC055025]
MSMPQWFRSSPRLSRRGLRVRTVGALAVALTVGLLPQYAPEAKARDNGPTRPHVPNLTAPAPGADLKSRPHQSNPAEKARVKRPADVSWPTAARDETTVGAVPVKADGLPIEVGPPPRTAKSRSAAASTPVSFAVETVSRTKTRAAGIDGVLFTISATDTPSTADPADAARLTLDYSGFADAYGGGYGSRLRLVQYPSCLLTTPEKAACSTPRELPATNDTAGRTLSADVPVASKTAKTDARTAAEDGGTGGVTVLAAIAAASGDQGSYGATPLAPSSEWSVANSSGAFNWSYPLRTPPAPGGLVPSVSFGYSSQSVDGQTATTNNQGSWIGQGFGYEPGFIERRYKPCADDGHDKTNGDQCWAYDNATIQLAGGTSGELIKVDADDNDAVQEWRVSNDANTKVEKLTGGANGDNDGEHWRVTSTDGVQYYFGLSRPPGWTSGKEETGSAWTVPVYGDDAGEPCYKAALADAHCLQAWRWNLDYVVDPHGNAMSYYYGKETNYYTQGLKTGENGKPYTRGGYLKRIDYGQRDGKLYDTPAPAHMVFTTDERCLDTAADCEPGDLTDATANRWPDVPWDRDCKADTKCPGQNSPTFWTRKKLSKVTTQIRSGTGYSDIDSWTLKHIFTDNGDSSQSLWLNEIKHTGHAGTSSVEMPSVELLGEQLPNRIDTTDDNIQPMKRFRLSGVDNDTGGQLDIIYRDAECRAGALPPADSSAKACYPVKWNPPGEPEPVTDWFHKYLVERVVQTDLTGGAPDMVSEYEYLGDAGWKMTEPDGITDDKYRTRSDWRGYGKVRVTNSGDTVSPANTRTEHTFLRGLGGQVTDSTGTAHADSNELSGQELETATYNGAFTADRIVSKSINTTWSRTTATRVNSWGTDRAYFVRPETTTSYTALESGGWQETKSTTRYDAATGRATEVDDFGATGDPSDNRCVRTQYADNTAKHMLSFVSRVEQVAVACGTTPDRRTQVISDDLTYYDGLGLGAAPVKGDTTKVQRLASHDGTQATYETLTSSAMADFDAFGRPLKVTDAAGKSTTIAYAETDGLTTKKTETNPLGWKTSTEYDRSWGSPAAQVDMNEKRTDLGYDALGRLTSVWLPDRPKASDFPPSIKYTYVVRKTGGPVAVKTEKLERQKDGTERYGVEYALYDGMLRPRQQQTEGPNGGRIIADTFYDGLGNIAKANADYFTTEAPKDQVFDAVDKGVNGQTLTEYDGAGRTTAEIFRSAGEEKWRTTYTYGGDRVHVDPPVGTPPTTTITNGRGLTTDIRRYKGDEPLPTGTPADYENTHYTYTPADQLKTVHDAAGNVWTTGYDQRGRKIWSEDPDTGRTDYGYDELDRPTSVTDARRKKISTKYDAIGRPVSTWEGEPDTGTRLTVSTYDIVAKGEPYGSYRYANGVVQSSTLNVQLDNMYQPTLTRVTLAGTEDAALKASYDFGTQYNQDGTVQSMSMPAAGGLPAETLVYSYDELQRPTALRTTLGGTSGSYVTKAAYSPTSQLQQLELSTGASGSRKTWLSYEYERGTERLTQSRTEVESVAEVTSEARYTYDASGNVTTIADVPTGGQADVQCFTYDWQRRLDAAWATSNSSDGSVGTGRTNTACAADPAPATIGGPAPYWHSFTYDTAGNRKQQTLHAAGGSPETVRTYTYGDANLNGTPGEADDGGPHTLSRMVRDVAAGGGSPAVHAQDTYTYDPSGSARQSVRNGTTQDMTWNAEGRLDTSTTGGATASFAYDAAGERLLRKEAGRTTLYLPGMELSLDTATKKVEATRYYSFAGRTVAMRTAGGVKFLAGDRHGTMSVAVDAMTGATVRRRMDPFGNERGTSSPWVDDKGFLGKPADTSTGFTHLGAREYEPENGRFISADPVIDVTDPQQMNGYAYSNNNPVTYSDPTGLCPADLCGIGYPIGGTGQVAGDPLRFVTVAPTQGRDWDYRTPAKKTYDQARAKADAAKIRAQAAAKELAGILADELGLTDALDCFTTGSLGACGATFLNVASSFLGGILGKLAAKYGMPWKWKKAVALGKRIAGLVDKLIKNFSSWLKFDKKAEKLAGAVDDGCNSFTPETKVLMADGTTKTIKDIDIGDKVVATDPESGKTRTKTVTAEITGKGAKNLVQVTLDTDGKHGNRTASVTATDGHPFWVPELGEWIDATDLNPGQWLRTSAGTYVQITAVTRWTQQSTVHNLTVADIHTYYVVAGATPVLVHNCDTVDLYRVSPRDRGTSELDNGVLPENHPLDLDEGLDGSAYFGNRQRVEDYASQHRDTHGQGIRVTVPSRWLRENDIKPMEDFLNEGAVEYAIPRHLFDKFNSFPRAPWNPGGK